MLALFLHQARPSANGTVGVPSLMAETYLAITMGHSASREPVTGEGDVLCARMYHRPFLREWREIVDHGYFSKLPVNGYHKKQNNF